jgi:hypothetical protein
MFQVFGVFVLCLAACGKVHEEKPPADRLINVHDWWHDSRIVVVRVGDEHWEVSQDTSAGFCAKSMRNGKLIMHYFPADQKAYDAIYEHLNGRTPLKAD